MKIKNIAIYSEQTQQTKEFKVEFHTKFLFDLLKSWKFLNGLNYHAEFIADMRKTRMNIMFLENSQNTINISNLGARDTKAYILTEDQFNEMLGFYTKGRYSVVQNKALHQAQNTINDLLKNPKALGLALLEYAEKIEVLENDNKEKNELIDDMTSKSKKNHSKKELPFLFSKIIIYDIFNISNFRYKISNCLFNGN